MQSTPSRQCPVIHLVPRLNSSLNSLAILEFPLHLKCTWPIKIISNWDSSWQGQCVCVGVWGGGWNRFSYSAFKQMQLAKWVLTHQNLKSNSWTKPKFLLLPIAIWGSNSLEIDKAEQTALFLRNSHNHLDQFRYCCSKKILKTSNIALGDEWGCSSHVLCSL